MATKTLKVVRAGRYGTRMLKAGDTLEATAPDARLYEALGWAVSGRARVADSPEARNPPKREAIPTVDEVLAAEAGEEKPKVKRARRRKKTA